MVIPRIDPRAAGLVFLSTAVWVIATTSVAGGLAWALGLILLLAGMSRQGHASAPLPRRWLAWTLLVAVATALLYAIFVSAGDDIVLQWGMLRLTETGLLLGMRMGLRLMALAVLAALAALVTAPLGMAAGVTRTLLPLRRVGVPVETIFYFAFFVLRMFPLLVRESHAIRLAQQARGIRFAGSLWARWRSLPALLVPVFAAALRRGDQLALALAARGMDVRRTPAMVLALRFRGIDWFLSVVVFAGWAAWLWFRLH
ncbi:MAG: energy-coupling factor transporter transmembrane component T [Candidatus Zixiibacteriota bacterium]